MGMQMGVLMVNWNDANEGSIDFDLIKAGIAESTKDNCVITDVDSGEVTNAKGTPVTVAGIPAHGYAAKMIKCLPW